MAEFTPREQAALDRFLAAVREYRIARFRLAVAVHDAAGALCNLADAWQRSEQRIAEREALEVAAHPDLAELNVELDARYTLD